jgi:hypothetical protein
MPCDEVKARWARSNLYCRLIARHAKSTNWNPCTDKRRLHAVGYFPRWVLTPRHSDSASCALSDIRLSFSSHPLPAPIILPMMVRRFRRMDRTWKYSICSKLTSTCKGPPFPPICSRTPLRCERHRVSWVPCTTADITFI